MNQWGPDKRLDQFQLGLKRVRLVVQEGQPKPVHQLGDARLETDCFIDVEIFGLFYVVQLVVTKSGHFILVLLLEEPAQGLLSIIKFMKNSLFELTLTSNLGVEF